MAEKCEDTCGAFCPPLASLCFASLRGFSFWVQAALARCTVHTSSCGVRVVPLDPDAGHCGSVPRGSYSEVLPVGSAPHTSGLQPEALGKLAWKPRARAFSGASLDIQSSCGEPAPEAATQLQQHLSENSRCCAAGCFNFVHLGISAGRCLANGGWREGGWEGHAQG